MKAYETIDTFEELRDMIWSGACETIKDVNEAEKQDELMIHLEEVFFDEIISQTAINDYLWHDRDSVYNALDMNEYL